MVASAGFWMSQWRGEWREDEGGLGVVCWWTIRVELPVKRRCSGFDGDGILTVASKDSGGGRGVVVGRSPGMISGGDQLWDVQTR